MRTRRVVVAAIAICVGIASGTAADDRERSVTVAQAGANDAVKGGKRPDGSDANAPSPTPTAGAASDDLGASGTGNQKQDGK
jgi:hypothetical protein